MLRLTAMPHLDRLPRWARLAAYAAANLVLLIITLAPTKDLPGADLGSDKAQHVAGWFVLTMLGLSLSPRRPRAIVAFALAMGPIVEIAQALGPFGRDCDWRDVVADSAGVALAVLCALVWRRIRKRAG
jgi:VanZ family protein